MKKLIIIKYGELTTKKDNINFFIKTLKANLEETLSNYKCDISYDKGRMFIESDDDLEIIKDKVKNTFGIHEINIAYKLDNTNFDNIASSLLTLIEDKEFNTFKVETKRSNKNYPMDSMEISRKLGGVVLKNKQGVKVDVHNPEALIHVEIRFDAAFIYFEKEKGLGGYPVGTLGKGLLMLSGGIDSPVAGYMALKRGVRLEAIYFDAPPHTSEAAKNKVINLAKKLACYSGYVKLHVINFTEVEENILKNCPRDYLITIMRRMMYRISETIAIRNNCKCLVNGESIGQVASQTLTSMSAIGRVVKLPVIRPVACLDKLDIIEIANQIDTYDISIEPYEDCCTIFVPDHPVINPEPELCEEYENNFNWQDMIKKCIEEETVIKIENKISEEYSSIL